MRIHSAYTHAYDSIKGLKESPQATNESSRCHIAEYTERIKGKRTETGIMRGERLSSLTF